MNSLVYIVPHCAKKGRLHQSHSVGVLSFGHEFREDGAFGGIQEKFWEALA
jgi:hypothetical protein